MKLGRLNIFAAQARPVRRFGRWLHAPVVVGIVLVGITISGLLYRADLASERRRVQTELERRVSERVELLREKLTRSTEVLHSIASFFEARSDVSRAEFESFVAGALARQPELLALSWTPRVPLADRERYESAAREDGLKDFRLVEGADAEHYAPVASRPFYLPVYYIAPVSPNVIALGFDLNSDPTRAGALDTACRAGSAVATPPIRLIQEKNNRLGFIVFYPIYDKKYPRDETDRLTSNRGFTAAVYRINDLVGSAFGDLDGAMGVTVEDETEQRTVLFTREPDKTSGTVDASLRAQARLDVAGRHWVVSLDPAQRMLSTRHTARPIVLLTIGLAMTGLLSAYMSNVLRQRAIVEREVHHRTCALTEEIKVRQRAEQVALAAELKYKSIFDNCTEGIFQTAPEGRYLSVNPALTRLYGYESPDELMRTLSDIGSQLYVDPKRRAGFVEAMRAGGVVSGFESEVYRRDGTVIWISESARAVHGEDGRLLYYEGVVEDITRRKTSEDRLKQAYAELDDRVRQRTEDLARINSSLQQEVLERKRAEALAEGASRAKSIFLANVSHEIRTPMNAITGYAQLLRRDPALHEHHREAIETIVTGADHLLNLIEELLDLSKAEAGEAELRTVPFDLPGLLLDAAALFRQACADKSVTLDIQLPSDQPLCVNGDEGKLRQVLINLLGNAVKFTDAGAVRLTVNEADAGIFNFAVSDTGVGIPSEMLGRIFEPFSRAHPSSPREGNGLGLAIARKYVALMGGDLSVVSAPEEGSIFSFAIPLPLESPGRESLRRAGRASGQATLPGKIRALVVDDVPVNRDVLRSMLQSFGCEVACAEDGSSGVELLKHDGAPIVFLDVLMPGLDGAATSRAMRAVDRNVKIVGVTALAPGDARVREAGFDACLTKPIRIEQLHASIVELLKIQLEPDRASGPGDEESLETIDIPSNLLRELICAAEIASVTDLKAGVRRLEALGPRSAGLVKRLRALLRTFDMEKVGALLAAQARTREEIISVEASEPC